MFFLFSYSMRYADSFVSTLYLLYFVQQYTKVTIISAAIFIIIMDLFMLHGLAWSLYNQLDIIMWWLWKFLFIWIYSLIFFFLKLWTVAAEIKYYFIIPLISGLTVRLGNYWRVAWILSAVFMIANEFYFNLFKLTATDFKLENAYQLMPRFSIFFSGSLVAILFNKIEKSKLLDNLRNKWFIQNGVSVAIGLLFVFGVRTFSEFWQKDYDPTSLEAFSIKSYINSGIYWAITMFLMLIGAPNFVTNVFSTSKFLKYCGKFSFGMYLLHPMCMTIIRENINMKSFIEFILLVVAFSFLVGYLCKSPGKTVWQRIARKTIHSMKRTS